MKRLVMNCALWTLAAGVMLFVVTSLAFTFEGIRGHPSFYGWSYFWVSMQGAFVIVFVPLTCQGLYALWIQRRLLHHFQFIDCWPAEPAYHREMSLEVTASEFLVRLRGLIERSLRASQFRDDPGHGGFSCRVPYGLQHNYQVVVLVTDGDMKAGITVSRMGKLARIVPVEVDGAQIIAGLVHWAADEGLVERDFPDYSRPERLWRDLGKWLPKPGEMQTRPAPSRPAQSAADLWRLIGAFAIGLAVFGVLVWLDEPDRPIPRFIKALPAIALLVYGTRYVVRRENTRRW